MALRDFYEGIGSNAKAIVSAEKDLQDFFYVDKDANCIVHTDDSKLRLLNHKIHADFLVTMKTSIQMEMNKTPRSMKKFGTH